MSDGAADDGGDDGGCGACLRRAGEVDIGLASRDGIKRRLAGETIFYLPFFRNSGSDSFWWRGGGARGTAAGGIAWMLWTGVSNIISKDAVRGSDTGQKYSRVMKAETGARAGVRRAPASSPWTSFSSNAKAASSYALRRRLSLPKDDMNNESTLSLSTQSPSSALFSTMDYRLLLLGDWKMHSRR